MRGVRDFSVDSSAASGLFKNRIYSSKFSYFNYSFANSLIVGINRIHLLHLHINHLVIGPLTLQLQHLPKQASCCKCQEHFASQPASHRRGAPRRTRSRKHQANRKPMDADAHANGHRYAQRRRSQAGSRQNRLACHNRPTPAEASSRVQPAPHPVNSNPRPLTKPAEGAP